MEEIEEAYQALRRMLPDVSEVEKESEGSLERTFEPLPAMPEEESSRRYVLVVVIVGVLFIMAGLALALLLKGRSVGYH
jgi:hypothetical protein